MCFMYFINYVISIEFCFLHFLNLLCDFHISLVIHYYCTWFLGRGYKVAMMLL